MAGKPVAFDIKLATGLRDMYRWWISGGRNQTQPMQAARRVNPLLMIEGKFTSALEAATAYDTPTTATFQPYNTVDDGETTFRDELTVTSRDEALEAESGTYGIVIRLGNEWRPIWVSCGG